MLIKKRTTELESAYENCKLDKCIVCGGRTLNPLYKGILKCHDCGHVSADFHLTEDEISVFYDRSYFFGSEYGNYLTAKDALQKNFRSRLRVIKKFSDPKRHSNLFEIGCAYGFFLDIARDSFDIVRGIDITEDGVQYAYEQLKLEVIQADFLRYDLGDEKFDVVCMWDTIEHLRNPHLYIEKVSEQMDRGALLALTTGNVESINANIRKDKWRFIKPPEHLHYFSRRTLTRMLDNYGFEVIYNRYCGNFMSIENIVYKLLILNNKAPSLYNFLHNSGLINHYLYVNFFDIMYIIARKR